MDSLHGMQSRHRRRRCAPPLVVTTPPHTTASLMAPDQEMRFQLQRASVMQTQPAWATCLSYQMWLNSPTRCSPDGACMLVTSTIESFSTAIGFCSYVKMPSKFDVCVNLCCTYMFTVYGVRAGIATYIYICIYTYLMAASSSTKQYAETRRRVGRYGCCHSLLEK